MKVLSRECAVIDAAVVPRYVEGSNKPASFDLKVQVGFFDRAARAELPGFDGFERLVLHVPSADGWYTVPMQWKGEIPRFRITLDRHEATIQNVDVAACLKEGVAVCLSTEHSAAALQSFGHNYPVTYRLHD